MPTAPETRSRPLRALGAALATLLAIGGAVATSPGTAEADGAGLPFDCIVPTFFAQAGTTTTTQLYTGSYLANGTSSWTALGGVQSGATNYNALAFNPVDEYLYAAVSDGTIVRIDSAGAATLLGATTPALGTAPSTLWDSGEFDEAGTYYVASGNGGTSAISKISDIAGARTKTALALGSTVRMADFSFKDGYLWSHTYGTAVPNAFYRIHPATGAVTTIPSTLIPAENYGSVFTMNNGNLAFIAANARMYQVAVADPAGPAPTFSLVSDVAAPTNARSDATNCKADPADLAVTVDGPASAEPGSTYSWTVTISNSGPGMTSGFVVKTQLPAGVTNATVSGAGAACTTSRAVITCNGGAISAGADVVMTGTATAPTSAGTIVTTTTVTGNELDEGAQDNVGTLTMTVAAAAPPPPALELEDDTATTPAGSGVSVDVLDNDTATGGAVTSVSTPTSGTAAVQLDGTVLYTPAPGFSGPATFDYTVTDAADQQATATVTVAVTPTAVSDSATLPTGGARTLDVLANDLGSGLTILGTTAPSRGTIIATASDIEYFGAAGYSGTDTFSYTVEDTAGEISTATVTLTITPLAVVDTPDTIAGAPITWDPSANDGGDQLVVTSLTSPAHGSAVLNSDGTVTYVATPGFSGPDSFTYTATDGEGGTVVGTVTVMVAPLAAGDDFTFDGGALSSFDLLGNDSGSGMRVTAFTDPAHGDLDVAPEGLASYAPEPGFSGTDTFDYTAEDASGQQTSATVTLMVVAPSAPPVSAPADPDAPDAPDAPAAQPDEGTRLATTGGNVDVPVGWAALLLLLGGGLLAARALEGRRRRLLQGPLGGSR